MRIKRPIYNLSVTKFALAKVQYTAISIKVVPKTREKVEYERERLIEKDPFYSRIHYHS